ncbi:MAG: hypothetical protein KDE49_09150 [Novosphingobium sp.]|nr:hypothetical protein [Novosphingobium sp.]
MHWPAGIGDPTLIGWLTVAVYAGAALACALTARAAKPILAATKLYCRHDRVFWLVATVIFVFFGVNKQLDLQSLFTELARKVAYEHHWYDERRYYQKIFIEVLLGAAILTGLALIWGFRRSRAPVKIAIAGLACTGAFVVLRAASFHHVDLLLGGRLAGVRWNFILEVTGPAIVATAALVHRALDEGHGP